jgi:hypothetical protein
MNTPQMDPERTKQVNEWLNELHGAVQQSSETCRQLRDRLSPVLRMEPAETCGNGVCPQADLVDVAAAIREAVVMIQGTTENHREMIRLLEV